MCTSPFFQRPQQISSHLVSARKGTAAGQGSKTGTATANIPHQMDALVLAGWQGIALLRNWATRCGRCDISERGVSLCRALLFSSHVNWNVDESIIASWCATDILQSFGRRGHQS